MGFVSASFSAQECVFTQTIPTFILFDTATIGPGDLGGEDAGPASSQQQEEIAGAGAGAGLAETLKALADNQAAFSGVEGGEDTLDDIPNELLEKLAAQLRGMEGLEGMLPLELLGGDRGAGVNTAPAPGGVESGSGAPLSTSGTEFPGMASLVDTIMHQLLSKDVLYQPMKDIGDKYPEWLAANKPSLDPGKYKQYEEQYEYIQKICTMYETEPENYSTLMDLLQEVGRNRI
jgi:peroxin-19